MSAHSHAAAPAVSEFRVEKSRALATLTLSNGALVRGYFFVSGNSRMHAGPEGIKDVLNAETGFFPFEDALIELVTKTIVAPDEASSKSIDKNGFEALRKRAGIDIKAAQTQASDASCGRIQQKVRRSEGQKGFAFWKPSDKPRKRMRRQAGYSPHQ